MMHVSALLFFPPAFSYSSFTQLGISRRVPPLCPTQGFFLLKRSSFLPIWGSDWVSVMHLQLKFTQFSLSKRKNSLFILEQSNRIEIPKISVSKSFDAQWWCPPNIYDLEHCTKLTKSYKELTKEKKGMRANREVMSSRRKIKAVCGCMCSCLNEKNLFTRLMRLIRMNTLIMRVLTCKKKMHAAFLGLLIAAKQQFLNSLAPFKSQTRPSSRRKKKEA